MMYIHQPSLQQLKQDLAAFVRTARVSRSQLWGWTFAGRSPYNI